MPGPELQETFVSRASRELTEFRRLLRTRPGLALLVALALVVASVAEYLTSFIGVFDRSAHGARAQIVATIGGDWENIPCKQGPYDERCRTCEAHIDQAGPALRIKQCGDDVEYQGEFIDATHFEVGFGLNEGCCMGELAADGRIQWSNHTVWSRKNQ